MMQKATWQLPIRTVSESNSSEHWSVKRKRHLHQQFLVRCSCVAHIDQVEFPCEVTLTRLAPRTLDSDNLVSCFKWIRDELSECMLPEGKNTYLTAKGKVLVLKGRKDSDPRITWHYAQEKKNVYGIRIDINYDELNSSQSCA